MKRWITYAMALGLAWSLIGCAPGNAPAPGSAPGSSPRQIAGGSASPKGGSLQSANAAYAAGDYRTAYAQAAHVADKGGAARDEAAYLAGLSARRLKSAAAAERYLLTATRSRNTRLSGNAMAELGLMYSEHANYNAASRMLSAAAAKLSGEPKAKAYYYAGIAQQKLGHSAQARTSFSLAGSATADRELRQQIDAQREVTGWTVQIGAYGDVNNARRAAAELAQRVRGAAPRLVASTDARGQSLTLVQIGQFATFDSARGFQTQLNQGVVVPLAR